MAGRRWSLVGGSAGNEQLTVVVASVLIVLLTIEGATLLNIRSLLTVHAFVGMLLIPVVALKLASTAWRMLHYYRGAEELVRRGPPHIALRVLVAPVTILSTLLLFSTGVALLVRGEAVGVVLALHKASFLVWIYAIGIHVIVHLRKLPRLLLARIPGAAARVGLVGGVVAAGLVLATATLPAADRLQDRVTAQIGLDES